MHYTVIDRQEAEGKGYTAGGEHNRYALVTEEGIICWGYVRENLQRIADSRNIQVEALRDRFTKHEL